MTNPLPLIKLGDGSLISMIDSGIDQLFQSGVSDVTIQSDDYIWAYHNRVHVCVSDRRMDEGQMHQIIRHLYKSDGAFGILGAGEPLDFDVDLRPRLYAQIPEPDYSVRLRANITRARVGAVANGTSITLRTIPGQPPEFASLKLPDEIVETFFPRQGLVLICGETGSGKSTLLAASLRHRQEQSGSPVKIVTYEDPIEFTFSRLPSTRTDPESSVSGPCIPRMPEVAQVQIGPHLKDFSLVSPNALRRKADVIVVGEMRDRKSVETGLLIAQTGHATYGTMHCETPAQAIPRLVSEFEIDGQPGVSNKLLDALRLIVAQKIVLNTEKKARAFRSWIVFDQALKSELGSLSYPLWSKFLIEKMQITGASFAQQGLQAFRDGEIDFENFKSVACFNPIEARAYLEANK